MNARRAKCVPAKRISRPELDKRIHDLAQRVAAQVWPTISRPGCVIGWSPNSTPFDPPTRRRTAPIGACRQEHADGRRCRPSRGGLFRGKARRLRDGRPAEGLREAVQGRLGVQPGLPNPNGEKPAAAVREVPTHATTTVLDWTLVVERIPATSTTRQGRSERGFLAAISGNPERQGARPRLRSLEGTHGMKRSIQITPSKTRPRPAKVDKRTKS